MENLIHNPYLFKALAAYPYDLEETMEALNYALSYDDQNVQALCLLGKVYAYHLNEYEQAKSCFEKAMASNLEIPSIYPDYLYTLIRNEDLKEAQRLLDFAMKIKGVDKVYLMLIQGQLFEVQKQFKLALVQFKKTKKSALNNNFKRFVNDEISRVKEKLGAKKKRKRRKKKKK
ncbi:tetratricopeptide repeat protein [Spongiivirga citrea]|uniref:Uncharacterized protein n=1 Tax=Spongiivirga citrea TaxID=1481457 RepID=A0A6M0CHD7_9FLAO|nr:hypothetical protein [Spongiivirga citrea]NER17358.1 hypothetical protein [Spongiivirga citrea]